MGSLMDKVVNIELIRRKKLLTERRKVASSAIEKLMSSSAEITKLFNGATPEYIWRYTNKVISECVILRNTIDHELNNIENELKAGKIISIWRNVWK